MTLPNAPGVPGPVAPDLLILNSTIRTQDATHPLVSALAIHCGRILAIGRNEDVLPLAGRKTQIVDGAGCCVLPGFNDAHVHFLSGGFSLSNVDLRNARTPAEFAQRVGAYAAGLPAGKWILDGSWDHEQWPGAPLPTKEMVDPVTPNNPVLVSRLDGHMSLANSLALKLAGITRYTQDPDGGVIVRDAQGEPTGVLKDAAETLVRRVIPPYSRQEKRKAILAATAHAAKCGVTSVTDMSADDDVGIYQEMAERGELMTRIYAARSIVGWECLGHCGVHAPFGTDMVRIGGIKGFSDGSLGSSTALFFEPYADEPSNRGLLFDQMFPEGVMLQRVTESDRAGLQVMIHAIGDAANAMILNMYEEVSLRNGARDRRFRIEHAQHLRPEDVRRIGTARVIASMQPYHAADDGRWCEKRLGRQRSLGAYAIRSLLDAGAMVAFGSDWTVAPLEPVFGIKAAVTRQTLDGKHPNGWIPGEKITVDEAVRAYTVGSAYAEFAEQVKGTVTPGKLADLVMLDRDIYCMPPETIDQARVIMTVLNGEVIYQAGT